MSAASTMSNDGDETAFSSAVAPLPPPTSSSKVLTTFYRRSLPETCIAFSSRAGRKCFESAMRYGGLKSFFNLMEQHSTQSEPAYCGISTLVIALNALAVDPRQTWKGPWRWYEESMLNCCVDLNEAKNTGITLPIFNTLAICQGLETELHYVDGKTTASNNTSPSLLPPLEQFRKAVQEACVEAISPQEDQDAVVVVDRVLIASYDRRVLQQTGSGHFSPIAAYDQESDSVLIMDTARFKYGAHWVHLPLLLDAMQSLDPNTGRSRGHVTLIHRKDRDTLPGLVHNLPTSVLLRTEMKQRDVRREFKTYLQSLEPDATTNYSSIANFCTKQGHDPLFVWEMTQPQLHPVKDDEDSKRMVDEVQSLIRQLLRANNATMPWEDDPKCRSHHCRSIHLQPEEAIFIIYLACLKEDERVAIVFDRKLTASDRTRRQLLAEARLYRYAIDSSDQY
jgi:glutathione gamma-glutamylcysteinyltransferase